MSGQSTIDIAVVGAHLTGQPLNGQLIERGATLVRPARTAPDYRLYALQGTVPAKPGLKRVPRGTGFAIEIEIWAMPIDQFGSFMKLVSAPLGIGTVLLEDGTEVKGFICETYAFETAKDISGHGGWRTYLARDRP
jgi:allophanate hydrolase